MNASFDVQGPAVRVITAWTDPCRASLQRPRLTRLLPRSSLKKGTVEITPKMRKIWENMGKSISWFELNLKGPSQHSHFRCHCQSSEKILVTSFGH